MRRDRVYGQIVRGRTASYLRREDGVLQIVRPAPVSSDTVAIELALATLGLALGAAAVMAGHTALAVLLLVTGIAHPGARVVRILLARRRARIAIRPENKPAAAPLGLHVVRLETPVPAARAQASAIRLPDTAASPQE